MRSRVHKRGVWTVRRASAHRRERAGRAEVPIRDQQMAVAERACHRYASDDGVQATVLRFFNVYGAGQHPSFLVSYVVDSLTRGARVTLRMPRAVRDFLYVDDAVDALLAASRPRSELFRVFNVGSGQGVTVTDLVGAAENVFGRAAGIDTAEPHLRRRRCRRPARGIPAAKRALPCFQRRERTGRDGHRSGRRGGECVRSGRGHRHGGAALRRGSGGCRGCEPGKARAGVDARARSRSGVGGYEDVDRGRTGSLGPLRGGEAPVEDDRGTPGLYDAMPRVRRQ